MKELPDWIRIWIEKDRLVRNKYVTSQNYLRKKRKIKELSLNIDDQSGQWINAHFMVNKFHVHYENGTFRCNCPFFKKRLICSHILGICQTTGVWPDRGSIFPDKKNT